MFTVYSSQFSLGCLVGSVLASSGGERESEHGGSSPSPSPSLSVSPQSGRQAVTSSPQGMSSDSGHKVGKVGKVGKGGEVRSHPVSGHLRLGFR